MIDLAASAGLILEPAQRLVLHGALGERRDGRWAAPQVVVVKPRQNGKDAIAEARELGGLYLFGERLQTHTAHRYDTVQEHFLRVKALCELVSEQTGNPGLKIKGASSGRDHAGEYIELMSGQRILFKTRSKLSGRGPSPQVVYLNEAMYLSDLGSLVPSMSAQDAPQVWWLGSAPLNKPESDPLRRMMRQCRAQCSGKRRRSGRIAYFEWSAHVNLGPQPDGSTVCLADVDITNKTFWAEANSGLGRRLTVDWIESVELSAMTREEFAAERLGLFMDIEEAADPVIPEDDWRACSSPTSRPIDPVTFAFEISLDRRWSCIGIAGRSTEGGKHVELVENRRGTGWVVDRLIELRDKHSPSAVVCNPAGPAGALLSECEAKKLIVGVPDPAHPGKFKPIAGRDYAQACGAALDDITEHRWRHIGDHPALNAAVSGAVERSIGDAMVFDRRAGVDISPLVAVTLAAWASGKPIEDQREPFLIVT